MTQNRLSPAYATGYVSAARLSRIAPQPRTEVRATATPAAPAQRELVLASLLRVPMRPYEGNELEH